MNSTTGEFSEIRKFLTNELYVRGTQSSVKKPFPRKVMNIRPLNLNGIKKELEEDSEEENEGGANFSKDNENISEIVPANVVEKNSATKLKRTCEEDPLKDITNGIKTDKSKIGFEDTDKALIEDLKNRIDVKTSISVVPEANENNIHYGKKNDSFDLDFSALTISTPVKEKENGNKALKVVKPDHTTKEQFEFVTPKVNNVVHKTQSSLTKKPCFRTPINSFNISTRKILTPSINIINKHPSPILIKDDLVHRNEEKHFSPVDNLRDDKFNIIKVNDIEYIILNMLGRGGSSEVFQCYNVDNQSHVAIKCVSLENSLTASSYINEVKLLHQLQKCDKIIKMHDYELLESQKKLLVVLEKGGEDLSTILKCLATQTSHIPMYMLLFYWMEMLYAVKQIHSYGVIHSDLKPSNFLKADGGLKLIDFGIASSVQTDMTSVIKTTAGGSCNYISPEALNNDSAASAGNQNSNNSRYKLHYKSDVWSLGCILYQFVYRRTPFQHISQLWPKLAAIMNPEHKIEYPEAQWVSPKIISTIKKCLQYNVKSRPSVDALIAEYEAILHNI